jgi:hypothetical protein
MDKPACGHCNTPLEFRRWSNRLPKFSEALADCPGGCGCWQIRYFDGKQASEPYQVKRKSKKAKRGSWRLSDERKAAIVSIYGSVQEFLDHAPLVCMSQQYNP